MVNFYIAMAAAVRSKSDDSTNVHPPPGSPSPGLPANRRALEPGLAGAGDGGDHGRVDATQAGNDSENAPMLAINRNLGYQPLPGAYQLTNHLTAISD